MGWTLTKGFKIAKNLRVNISKSGLSVSMKFPGLGSLNYKNGRIMFSGSRGPLRVRKTLVKKAKKTKKGGIEVTEIDNSAEKKDNSV